VLAEAIVALALLGLTAAGGASLVHAAAQVHRQAERLDLGLLVGETILARMAVLSFTRLPEFFSAPADASFAQLDTADGSAPRDWSKLLADLPTGRITATLQGLTVHGDAAQFDGALALRLRVRASWSEKESRRYVELTDVRF
jgi:hypothetical protein